jgi:hypothetical protein
VRIPGSGRPCTSSGGRDVTLNRAHAVNHTRCTSSIGCVAIVVRGSAAYRPPALDCHGKDVALVQQPRGAVKQLGQCGSPVSVAHGSVGGRGNALDDGATRVWYDDGGRQPPHAGRSSVVVCRSQGEGGMQRATHVEHVERCHGHGR